MKVFSKLKVPLLLISLFILSIAVPLAIITDAHVQATHAAAPSTLSKGYYSSQVSHRPSVKFDSTLSDWPEFHGDAARDGTASGNIFFNNANATTLTPVSGPGFTTTNAAMSSPAIYQGVVYYTSNVPVITTVNGITQKLDTSTIYAVDATFGQVLWSTQTPLCGNQTKPGYIVSSPAVTTGMVNGVATTEIFVGRGLIKRLKAASMTLTAWMAR